MTPLVKLAIVVAITATITYAVLLSQSTKSASEFAPVFIIAFLASWGYIIQRLERTPRD